MNVTPEALLEAMCEDASPRKAQTLRLLYSICQEQQERGSPDYSIATIGKLSAERGGAVTCGDPQQARRRLSSVDSGVCQVR